GRGPADASPLLRFWNAISYANWSRLEEAVRTGEGQSIEIDERLQAVFSEGVEAFTTGPAHELAAAYDFGRHARVLDAGGGTGSFLVVILSAHSGLEGTLFELPDVVEVASPKLSASAVADRVVAVAGDLFANDLPAGHDAVILANVVHYFLPERNLEL